MKSARFTIAGMLATIGGLGIGFAALTHPNEWTASALLTMTYGLLLVSLLAAVGNHDIRRAFWMGFALFGWAYGLVNLNVGPGGSVSQDLITTRAIDRLRPVLHPNEKPYSPMIMNWNGTTPLPLYSPYSPNVWAANGSPNGVNSWPAVASSICPSCGSTIVGASADAFSRIGQSVATVIVALLGGITGTIVFQRARRHERRNQDSTSSEIALNEPLRSA
jgi:hypothetical protein